MKTAIQILRRAAKRLTRRAVAAAALAVLAPLAWLSAQTAGFRFRGALVRVITPNGDGSNDVAILCFENPRFSGVAGTVYDLRGQEVAAMVHVPDPNGTDPTVASCRGRFPPGGSLPNAEALVWDGRSDGGAVAGGVYIYQVRSEDVAATGTLVVAR